MTDKYFRDLGLADPLNRALKNAGLKTPTPIQAQAIPVGLGGHDLLGIAQTGTGKTAAFTLPILQHLLTHKKQAPGKAARALILAPTRELVLQIGETLKTLSRDSGLTHAVVMGGVSIRTQINAVRRGVDVLIATPGRLIDLVDQRHLNLEHTRFLVLDEADRMLDMGFIRDVRKIVAELPVKRQTLFFSATMPGSVEKLAAEILNEPKRVEIAAKSVAVERIEQSVHHVEKAAKRAKLTELLEDADMDRVIVFTRTKHGADKVVRNLKQASIRAEAIHGNKSQGQRQRSLDNFRKGRIRVLVATDIASRGIDVDHVSHVINYELPNEPESYVHRIGRTARAGAEGVAISLCSSDERAYLRDIEKLIKRPLKAIGDVPVELVKGNEGKPGRNGRSSGAPKRRRRRFRRPAQKAA
ncbi:MAG: DEAD/DEAH box helicase [Pseudomonadota bacterium]